MRPTLVRTLTAVAIVACVAPIVTDASAGELVRFVDGRYLEIEEHAVHGQAIRLTVAGGGVLVFAADRVEWIERAGLRILGEGPAETAAGRTPAAETGVTVVTAEAGKRVPRPEAGRPEVRDVARDFSLGSNPKLRKIR